jgi:hypothetical protein
MFARITAQIQGSVLSAAPRDGKAGTKGAPASRWARALLRLLLAAGLIAAGAQTTPGFADEYRWHRSYDHEYHERDFHDRSYFDHRFGHDHYYPPVGFVFGGLPPGYMTVYAGGAPLYFSGGVWYRAYGPGRFVVVAPPLGIAVPVLPPGYVTVWAGGAPYYYANNTYYVQTPQGYMVATAPATVQMSPPPAPSGPVYVEKASQAAPTPAPASPPASAQSALPPTPASPPASAEAAPPPPPSAAAAPRATPSQQVFAYPQRNQTPEQQARDRYECHSWAVTQSGFDPSSQPASAGATAPSGDYRRAMGACLEARGYSVN